MTRMIFYLIPSFSS